MSPMDKVNRRRSWALLLVCTLGFGLLWLVIAYAGRTPMVEAGVLGVPSVPQAIDLVMGKEGPEGAYAGRVVTYTISISNDSGSPISSVVVTDTWAASEGGVAVMPAEFNGNYWVAPFDFVSQFTYTLPTEQEKSGLARWHLIEPLPSGFQGTIEFTMSVPITLQPLHARFYWNDVGPSLLGNSVAITGAGVSVNQPDQVATAIWGPVLKLEKFAATEPGVGARPGRLITYTLRLDNLQRQDSVPATGIVIGEILPIQLIYEGAWADVPGSAVAFDPVSRHITWTLAPGFTLNPGAATTVTFAARLSTTQSWRQRIDNNTDDCWAIANELAKPVECWDRVQVTTLGILGKTFVAEPDVKRRGTGYAPLDPNETYANRYVTYTVYVFNPLSQTLVHNLWVTDVMPPTWDFIEMVDGPDPVWPVAPGPITNTMAWHWPTLQPHGVISFTFLAHVGPDTPVTDGFACRRTYYNDLTAAADEFPIVYVYENGLAAITALPQIRLDKQASHMERVANSVVTYTATLENQGDRPVGQVRFTDTLPTYFTFDGMVSGPVPAYNVANTVAWDIPTAIPARSVYELVFRARVDGAWNEWYYNGLDGYSPETSFCPRERAAVTVLSPIVHVKEANPALDSGEWVVQGEWFEYNVEYWNRSLNFTYTLDTFWDMLRAGFEVNGSQLYTTTSSDLPFPLPTAMQGAWTHTFAVDTPGEGSGTPWCNNLRIDEEGLEPEGNREFYQDKITFGVHVDEIDAWTYNADRVAYMLFKPHVDLRQIVYPKRVGLSGTVEVSLTLHNNMRDWHSGTARAVDNIVVTYTLPNEFVFVDVVPPTPPPTIQTEDRLVWTGVNLNAGEGQETHLRFLLQAPSEETLSSRWGYAYASPSDPSICIPNSQARYYVVKGVEVQKQPHPDVTGPFGVVEYDLRLINKTTAPVTGLTITDTLPPGFEFVSVLPGYPEPDSTNPLVWRDLSIAASPVSGFEKWLQIRYKARASGLFGVYYNRVKGLSASTSVTYADDYWDDVELSVLPGVGLDKVVRPEQAAAGQTVVYTLTVNNRSGKAIAGVRVTDTLPSGFSYQGMVAGADPVATTPGVVWTVDRVDNEETVQFVFAAAIDGQLRSGTYCNRARGMAHEVGAPTERVTIPDTDQIACVAVQGMPVLARSKTVAPPQVRAGNLVTYTITIYNETDDQQRLRLTDTLPLSITFDSLVAPTPAPVLTSPVVWQDLEVGALQTATLIFRARVDLYARSGTYYNRLDAATDMFKLPPTGQLAPLQVEEVPRYDLQVTKDDDQTAVDEGQLLLYTIVYTNVNQAGLTLTDVVITDTFSPPPPYAGPIGVEREWGQVATDVYTHFVGDLAPGESGSVQFNLQLADAIPPSRWVISNTVEIGHSTDELAFETDPGNNRFTDLDILSGPDLIIDHIEVTPPDPKTGEPVTFAVTVRNRGKDRTRHTASDDAWFVVELYLKGTAFLPPGPPSSVFDHYGGICPDLACTGGERPEYRVFAAGLDGYDDETILNFRLSVDEADDYQVYAQADVSFQAVEEPWGHDYGVILEAIESNNIFSYGTLRVDQATVIYLPIITKHY